MPEPLRICMTSDDFVPAATGVGVHLNLIAPELVRRGHQVTVVTTRRDGQGEVEDWQGVQVLRTPTLRVYGFYQALPSVGRLRALFASRAPQIVHHHYAGLMMLRAVRVAEELGLPQVSTYHFGPEVLTQPWPMRPARPLVRRLMVQANNRCQMVISPSANLLPALRAMGITSTLRHITNPVAFGGGADVSPADRETDFVVLFAGRFGPEKNIGLLVRAFAQAFSAGASATLWLAGRGPEEASLRRLVAELGLGERVQFLGFLDHDALARRYAACDVFVLPSLYEVQPLVAMEAMSFGRPVLLTSALASAAELVDPGRNGYIVDPREPSDLARRLLQLAQQPELRAAMGAVGRSLAGGFRPAVVVDALEAAYRDLIG